MTDTKIDIVELRRRLGITRKQLAEMLGVKAVSTVCRWENGTKDPSGAALVLLRHLDTESRAKSGSGASANSSSRKLSRTAAE